MNRKLWPLLVLVVSNVAAAFITVVGPWPAYLGGSVESASYYKDGIAAIDRQAAESSFSEEPGRLQAGWAKARLTPPLGTPLAGYGDRKGAPSIGVHDELWVKALALSDGQDIAVIVGSDMLIVPENVADGVRERVGEKTGLAASAILFNASHSHSGPGAFGPGFLAKQFAGEYDPAVVSFLIDVFTAAITEAAQSMEPAALAYGRLDAKDYIRNRTRDAQTDSVVNYLVIRQDDADQCYVVRYSAHATVLGGDNMLFSGDYPGFLQRAIEVETGAFAMFLGGAVGSMGPRASRGADDFSKAYAMGKALAGAVLEATRGLVFSDRLDVISIGIPARLPPFQLRLNQTWRFSPFLFRLVGLDRDGWFHGVRVGDVVLIGTPADFSGEISNELRAWADQRRIELWTLSFSGDYVGYISPDRYYGVAERRGMEGYEMYLMSWCGPNQEAYFAGLCKHLMDVLVSGPAEASTGGV